MWPTDAESLVSAQEELARASPEPWRPPDGSLRSGGCWVCFPRGLTGPGERGDPAWATAVTLKGVRVVDEHVLAAATDAAYTPGLLALRIGRLLEEAVRGLAVTPDVLLLDASGRDHPRRAGLALHLGQVLDVPTVGVTHRPLLAEGEWPDDRVGATAPLRVDDSVVACWLRTRAGARPLVVHPGWCVDLATAVDLVAALSGRWRTPEPLRRARQVARRARAVSPSGGRHAPLV